MRWISPLGMLRKVPSRRASHRNGRGRDWNILFERHGWQTVLRRTRSARDGRRRRTKPKSSGWRSDQGWDSSISIMTKGFRVKKMELAKTEGFILICNTPFFTLESVALFYKKEVFVVFLFLIYFCIFYAWLRSLGKKICLLDILIFKIKYNNAI
jgi:hypothetical protein